MCSRFITSFWAIPTRLSSLVGRNQLQVLLWSSRAAHSEVDAINKELAEFFGVEYTSDSHSDNLCASSPAGGSAQHTCLDALPSLVSNRSALPEAEVEHSELPEQTSPQGARLTHSQQLAHTIQQIGPLQQQLQQCTVKLQELMDQQLVVPKYMQPSGMSYKPQLQQQHLRPQSAGPSDHRQPWDIDPPGTRIRSLPSAAGADADADASGEQTLTHVDSSGKASMVDVSHKDSSSRTADASCIVHLGPAAYQLVKSNQIKKGDVLTLAQIAGIQGAKQTAYLIPLCHNIFLSKVEVHLQLVDEQSAVVISSTAKTTGQTGVEMEALTAAVVAALTVYDMCKAVSKDIVVSDLRLDFKAGGKSGTWARA